MEHRATAQQERPLERPLPEGPAAAAGPSVAYLVSAYPALSHAFIEREVLALRAAGARVETFTVRAPDADARLSVTSRAEAERTTALVGQPLPAYAAALADLLRARPTALLRGVAAAWGSGPRSPRARLWQQFYLVEAAFLLQQMRRRGLRHVHAHFANNGADVARLVVALGRALDGPDAGWAWSFTMHGPTEFDDVDGHDLPAKARSASAVACISEYCRDRLSALAGPEHRAKMSVVRMGVGADRFPPSSALRAARPPGPLRVLFVGRLVPEKGPELLLRAARSLRDAGRALEVVLVGAGPLRAALEQEVRERGLQDVVRLQGPVGQDDLPGWYEWADVFCLPSYAEGVPVVLMEAMATELPVVTTPVAGVPELVADGATGLLVDPGDVPGVAAAIERLAQDAPLRHELGRSARERVLEEFQPGPNARRMLEVLGAVAAGARAERGGR
ncbi:glycosyltransferase family 4 protein [Kineococcus indalonis]|uniref:glycosyltransferase family 4 protein n=1 Tax=Kineococcus indalonis TaxID=2696566 RepID=UPI00141302E3|nr:glycosyltransferase family 4 protein [Kineococcus indalonis]NAZ85189.1 glycosyltransferase [Kineococcus indalonis]